jgi:DNA-directed RNA polymerase specialized sigma24 family protein
LSAFLGDYAYLYRAVRLELGPRLRRHLDPDDILQETFVTAMRLAEDVEPAVRQPADDAAADGDLRPWLMTIARRKVHDAVRYHGRKKRSGPRTALALDVPSLQWSDAAVVDRPGLLERLAWEEAAQRTAACVVEMQPDYQDVLVLRDFFEVPWSTVAFVLDRDSIGAAQQLYQRARAKLAQRARELDPCEGSFETS